jgi:mycothiol synthase
MDALRLWMEQKLEGRQVEPNSALGKATTYFLKHWQGLTGFCRIGTYSDDDGRLVGEVKLVGVRREARGRGLGRELVRWGVHACRERAVEDVYLSVEGENVSALRLYESLGFRTDVEWPHWVIPTRRTR